MISNKLVEPWFYPVLKQIFILLENGIWGHWGKWEFWKCNPSKGCLKKRRQPCIGTKPCNGKEPQQSECKFHDFKLTIRIFLKLLSLVHCKVLSAYYDFLLISRRHKTTKGETTTCRTITLLLNFNHNL